MDEGQTRYVGTNLCTLLGVLFIGLRLAGIIDWPWWVVLAPIWAPILFSVVFIIGCLVILWWDERRKH